MCTHKHTYTHRAIGREDSLSASFSFSFPPSSARGAGWGGGRGQDSFDADPRLSPERRWLDGARGNDDSNNEAPRATAGGDIEQGGMFPFGAGLRFGPEGGCSTVGGGGGGGGGETWDCMAIVSLKARHGGEKGVGARGRGGLNDGGGSRGSKVKGRRNSWWGYVL